MIAITYWAKAAAVASLAAALMFCGSVLAPAPNAGDVGQFGTEAAYAKAKQPTKAKITSVRLTKAGKMAVKAKKVKGAKKYQFQVTTDPHFKKNVKSVKTTKTKVKISRVTLGGIHHVRVRANVSGKWSKWSNEWTVMEDGTALVASIDDGHYPLLSNRSSGVCAAVREMAQAARAQQK